MEQKPKPVYGNNNPDDDITRTPDQARQGPKGIRVKWILVTSLMLAVLAGFLVWGLSIRVGG